MIYLNKQLIICYFSHFCYILMIFLSIYGISYTIGKLEISSFKWDTNLSMNSVHSPFIHYLLYNIPAQISRLLSIQLPLYKGMRCTRQSLLSAYHYHKLPWVNLIGISLYYSKRQYNYYRTSRATSKIVDSILYIHYWSEDEWDMVKTMFKIVWKQLSFSIFYSILSILLYKNVFSRFLDGFLFNIWHIVYH